MNRTKIIDKILSYRNVSLRASFLGGMFEKFDTKTLRDILTSIEKEHGKLKQEEGDKK